MTARRLYFTAPETVEVRRTPVPDPGPTELRVHTEASAISAGTEGVVYRNETPTDQGDESLPALPDELTYPFPYGYAAVGRVTAAGEAVDSSWLDRRVFAYHPHASHFLADPDDLVVVPDDLGTREATLIANAETAVTLVLDGEPLLGERVVVFGQGVVGLLTTALLATTSIETLVTVDRHANRRKLSRQFGADRSVPPAEVEATLEAVGGRADLTYELSGNPEALDDAVSVTGFDGRVVVGSWYGDRACELELGGRFHRDRIELRSSQVSTIPPRHAGRFSRERRHEIVLNRLADLELSELFTHEFPIEEASEAYRTTTERPDDAIQVLLRYS